MVDFKLAIVVLLLVGIPWLIIFSIVKLFKHFRKQRRDRAKQKKYNQNPCLFYEEIIDNVERQIKEEMRGKKGFRMNPLGPGKVPQNQINGYGQGHMNLGEFKSRYEIKAGEIRNSIINNNLLTEENKYHLLNYIKIQLGGKIENEQLEKAKHEVAKLAQSEMLMLVKRKFNEKVSRRKSVIDRLAGLDSYVLIDSDSPLFKRINCAYTFKSNNWEYRNGDYILAGAQSYDEGVVNLYKNLFRLKKRNAIKKRDALTDPRMI